MKRSFSHRMNSIKREVYEQLFYKVTSSFFIVLFVKISELDQSIILSENKGCIHKTDSVKLFHTLLF